MNTKAKPEDVAAATAPRKFKTKRIVTIPQLKWEEGVTYYLRFDSPAALGKSIEKVKNERGEEKKPPMLCQVTNLETGELQEVIMGAVLLSTLNEAYPNDAYVGLSFAITKEGLVKGKSNSYARWHIEEVE